MVKAVITVKRSYYKGKRRDKKAKIGKGNQGAAGMSKITDQLDRSKQNAPINSPKASKATDSPQGPRTERPQGKSKVSKKKGGKKSINKW